MGDDTGSGDTGGVEGGEVNCDESSGESSTQCSVDGQICTCNGSVVGEQDGDECLCAMHVTDVDCGDTSDTGGPSQILGE